MLSPFLLPQQRHVEGRLDTLAGALDYLHQEVRRSARPGLETAGPELPFLVDILGREEETALPRVDGPRATLFPSGLH